MCVLRVVSSSVLLFLDGGDGRGKMQIIPAQNGRTLICITRRIFFLV